jgi:hypothetical protein
MQARRVGGAECSARRTAKRDFLWTGDGAPAGSGPGSPCAARSVARGGRRELHSPHLRAYICDNPDGNLEKASSVCTCNEDRRLFLKLNTCVCMVFLGARLARQQSRSGGISGPDHGLSCMVQADRMSHRIGACARSPSHSRVRTSPSASDGGRRPMSTPPGLVHPRLMYLILPEVAPRGGSIQNSPAGLTTVHTWRPRHIHTFTYTVRPPGMCGTQSQNHTPLKDTTRGRGELPAGRHTQISPP